MVFLGVCVRGGIGGKRAVERRRSFLAKAIQHKQLNSPSVKAEDGWGGGGGGV